MYNGPVRAGAILCLSLHILAAAVWIGGMVFFAVVVIPVLRQPDQRERAADLIQRTGTRFRAVGWICMAVLLVTGAGNLYFDGFRWSSLTASEMWQTHFGHILGWKLSLVGLILALSLIHDLWIGPRATAIWLREPTSGRAARLRRRASWMGRLTLALSLVVLTLAVALSRS